MAELFDTTRNNITMHIKNIFEASLNKAFAILFFKANKTANISTPKDIKIILSYVSQKVTILSIKFDI